MALAHRWAHSFRDRPVVLLRCMSPLMADCVAKVFLAFGRETLIQDRARTSNNDSKEPTLRFDNYKFLFHRASSATFATQSARSGGKEMSAFGPLVWPKQTSITS